MIRKLLPLVAAIALVACQEPEKPAPTPQPPGLPAASTATPDTGTLTEVATNDRQWTGLAVAPDGRIFVCFPRWSDDVPVSVALLGDDGTPTPYPDKAWNAWTPTLLAESHFVCAQAAVLGPDGGLWVLDPASPRFQGAVRDGPKLVKIDAQTGKVKRNIALGRAVAPKDSYLNDVRISPDGAHAYITDSGRGGLVVVRLDGRQSWRVLDRHFSTHAEGYTPTIGGKPFGRKVHADGIALLAGEELVVYQALTARHLYAIPTAALNDAHLSAADREAQIRVRTVDADGKQHWTPLAGRTLDEMSKSGLQPLDVGASDGLLAEPDGNVLLTSLEFGAIRRVTPTGIETVAKDDRIAWPDSLARGPDGAIYFTTSQIHIPPADRGPYRLFRIQPK